MAGTAEFQNLIDINTETKGLQLPDNFESKFGDKASRQKIVDAAQDKFTSIDKADKTAIIDKAAAEIKSWTKKPEAMDKDYSSKIAVLYLYTLLNDPTKNHTTNAIEVLKNYDTLKTNIVPTAQKEANPISIMESKKIAVVSTTESLVKKVEMRTKTPEEVQNEKIMNLQSLQTSEAFKKIPATLQKKINTILNLTEKDNQTDKKMEEITKDINNINTRITALQEQNKIKQTRISEITQTILIMRENNLPRKDLRQERRILEKEISDNNDILYGTGGNDGLINDLADQKKQLIKVTDQKNGITENFKDKLVDVDILLASEITKRTVAARSIPDENTKKTLQEQITNLKAVQDKLIAIQTKEPDGNNDVPVVAKVDASVDETSPTTTDIPTAVDLSKAGDLSSVATDKIPTENTTDISKMSPEARDVYTNSLTTIDVATATELAKLENGSLQLNGLTMLDPATAAALHQLPNGDLFLNGLTSINKETAIALTKGEKDELFNKGLYLNGLTTLDPATATVLDKIPVGNIHMNISNWRPTTNETKTDLPLAPQTENTLSQLEKKIKPGVFTYADEKSFVDMFGKEKGFLKKEIKGTFSDYSDVGAMPPNLYFKNGKSYMYVESLSQSPNIGALQNQNKIALLFAKDPNKYNTTRDQYTLRKKNDNGKISTVTFVRLKSGLATPENNSSETASATIAVDKSGMQNKEQTSTVSITPNGNVDNNPTSLKGNLTPQELHDQMNKTLGLHETQNIPLDANGKPIQSIGSAMDDI